MSPQRILTTVMTRIVVDKTIYHAKPHSICFLPQYQRNEIFVLTIENTDSDLKVVEKPSDLILCLFAFMKATKFRDSSEYSQCVQNVLTKSCLPCQILYKPKKKFAERGKA